MKKKTFFLSSLVAVTLFVAAMSFTSCNKEDVDYDSMNMPSHVVTPESLGMKTGSYDSYTCPWCNTIITPDASGNAIHVHVYGPATHDPATLWCEDEHCRFHPSNPRNDRPTVPRNHRHVFYISPLAWGGQYHYGGQIGHIGF